MKKQICSICGKPISQSQHHRLRKYHPGACALEAKRKSDALSYKKYMRKKGRLPLNSPHFFAALPEREYHVCIDGMPVLRVQNIAYRRKQCHHSEGRSNLSLGIMKKHVDGM